jgi:hypothetical protein
MVGLQTLDLAIGVRVPASQPNRIKQLRAAQIRAARFCVPTLRQRYYKKEIYVAVTLKVRLPRGTSRWR